MEKVINELFEGHTVNYIRCINVDYQSERKESFMDLQVRRWGLERAHVCCVELGVGSGGLPRCLVLVLRWVFGQGGYPGGRMTPGRVRWCGRGQIATGHMIRVTSEHCRAAPLHATHTFARPSPLLKR